jgi:hypothetical protein
VARIFLEVEMDEECHTQTECIESDLVWLKDELLHLTKDKRVLILEEYERNLWSYGIGVREYTAFIEAFNQLTED